MDETKVIHINYAPVGWEDDPNYVYIGRSGKGLKSIFGNPFRIVSGRKRGSTLEKYRKYLIERLQTDKEFRQQVRELKGKTLVCFCKPKPCHGDILAEYADII